jgi:Skp family chaperone for outer membrane proteins
MWTAIALIAIAGIFGEAYRHKTKAGKSNPHNGELEALQRKVDALEADLRDRVETLERIVTDSKEDLKRQFDHLDKVG